ncbi:MAG: phosphomethylpyrimidine kinase [Armatimonadetes bacterium]|jgi:hydroxymethylpyrimidine kinase/phosphomethylpyrimidine kinase|nr:phosphomethylpyrimidine kinase [Armatimonadota bacterium]
MNPLPKVALTIAGSDTSGGAGIQMDLKVFQSLGVHGASVETALTAQNTTGVHRVHRIPPVFVAAQIDAVAADLPIAAAKTGMLHRREIVEVVAERIERRRIPNLVVDPVILAKDGTPLLSGRGIASLKRRLLPQTRCVTPNVPEAEALSGVQITDEASLREAALRILELGVAAVLIKGGHLPGEPVDRLFCDDEVFEFPGLRIEGPPVHGTGCLFSAALAARLALGDPLPAACDAAKGLVTTGIRRAVRLGKGSLLAVV